MLAIWRVIGWSYAVSFIPLILWLLFSLVQPLVASLLINYASDPHANLWYGLCLVASDLLACLVCMFGIRHKNYIAVRTEVRVSINLH